jgi:AcrR family transcriptional regulator
MGKGTGLRARQRVDVRRSIQRQAMTLFLARGYDATTVNDVANAAGVSPMTVYRHFPTKEDLVFGDEYTALVADRVAARPSTESLVQRIGRTLVEDVGLMIAPEDTAHGLSLEDAQLAVPGGRDLLLARLQLVLSTPTLRARQWDGQHAIQKAIVEKLRGTPPDRDLEFRLWVASGACLAAFSASLLRWAEDGGEGDLQTLVGDALAIAFEGQFP